MAHVIKRVWKSGPRKVKKVAWGYTLQVAGKQERTFNGAWTEDDAQRELGERLEQVRAGVERLRECTLAELADEYLAHKTDTGKRSLREDRRILKKRLVPTFGATTKVRTLRETTIAVYAKQRLGEVSAFTVANELTVLRHMLRLARKWGYLDRVPDVELPKRPEWRQRYLEEDEISRLLAACRKSRNPYLAAIVIIALNTGMRKAEILELTWERVDLSTSRLTLYKTKSGKPRGVPVNRAVYDVLVALQPDAKDRAGLLFKRSTDRAWGQIRTAFTTALTRAEIKGFRFHDLRHTAASHMVMRGAGLKDVQEILGHADMKMTMRYSHLSPAHLRATVDRLDGLTERRPAPDEELRLERMT
jgi:integrase